MQSTDSPDPAAILSPAQAQVIATLAPLSPPALLVAALATVHLDLI